MEFKYCNFLIKTIHNSRKIYNFYKIYSQWFVLILFLENTYVYILNKIDCLFNYYNFKTKYIYILNLTQNKMCYVYIKNQENQNNINRINDLKRLYKNHRFQENYDYLDNFNITINKKNIIVKL